MAGSANDDLERLIEHVRAERGFDFSGYKRTSLRRRVDRRLQQLQLSDYASYLDLLQVDPDEFAALFDVVLINVTSFFRDTEVWSVLADTVRDRLSAVSGPLRAWSAGCASGEEPYSIAMLLAESLGLDRVREDVKIYATDADEPALSRAREAAYTASEVESLPEGYVERYFEPVGDRWVVRQDLRRSVIFGRHDLTRDAPISRVDLLLCRNVLMYFNAEAQAAIVRRFHFALADRGVMCLGRAEMLLGHHEYFTAIDMPRRIFARTPGGRRGDLLIDPRLSLRTPDSLGRLGLIGFESAQQPTLLVDTAGRLEHANEKGRELFRLSVESLGAPLWEYELSMRPPELRPAVEQAMSGRRPGVLPPVSVSTPGGESLSYEIRLTPLQEPDGVLLGVALAYVDVTRHEQLQAELGRTNQALASAYQELQSTVEELETTNEELQSTVEELETTNEELQSTNEELETMNEELQSTNEELQTMNDELRLRTDELNRVNAFLESILASLDAGVAVVDTDLTVLIWNDEAENLWGLRRDEVVGRPLMMLDFGLPVDRLTPLLRRVIAQGEAGSEVLPAHDRRGKAMSCTVRCHPLRRTGRTSGAIILMEADGLHPPG